MAEVDFASQVLQNFNTRAQMHLQDSINANAAGRAAVTKLLMDKLGEKDEQHNPVIKDPQQIDDLMDQIKSVNGGDKMTGGIIERARDAFKKIHGLLGAPPQVRQQAHQQAMSALSQLSGGEGGQGQDAAGAGGPMAVGGPAPTTAPAPTSAGGAMLAPPLKSATTTPAQQAAQALPPPSTGSAPATVTPPPVADTTTTQGATATPTATAPPNPTGTPAGSRIAQILSRGPNNLSPLELDLKEKEAAHKQKMEEEKQLQEGRERVAQIQAGARPIPGGATNDLTPEEVLRDNPDGNVTSINGNPIDLDAMKPDEALHEVRRGKYQVVPRKLSAVQGSVDGKPVETLLMDKEANFFTQDRKPVTGNVRRLTGSSRPPTVYGSNGDGTYYSYQADPLSRQEIAGSRLQNVLPPAQYLSSISTSQEMAVDPDTGSPVWNTKTATRKPNTPATTATPVGGGSAGGGSAAPAPAAAGGNGVATTPTAAPGANATKPTTPAAAPAAPKAPNTPAGMPVGLYSANVAKEIPLREAYTQILGSPKHPDLTSLKDFASIADDPVKRAKLNAAVKATLDPIELQEKTHGGLLQYISLVGGLPQAINQAQSGANAKLIQDNIGNDPDLQRAYNSIMTSFSNIIGLRAFTKASAAEFSVKQLSNELPIPGGNSFNSRDYYDKMAKLALNLENVSRKTPTMGADERKYISDQVDNLSRLAKGTAITPPPRGNAAPSRPPLNSFEKASAPAGKP